MIAEVVRKHFGTQLKPIKRPVYRKRYPGWINKIMPLLKGYKVLDFTTFLGDDDKSTMKYIGEFTTQYGEISQNEYCKLQLFPLSLTRIAFTWYSSLLHNFM